MTEIIETREDIKPEGLEKAVDAIREGELVIYPTETVYGLAADATSDEAVRQVFEAKQRPEDRPISMAVDSLSMAYQVGKISEREADVIQAFLPGPVTLLVDSRPLISDVLIPESGKVGIRIPDHPAALELVRSLGFPITSTSANLSGNPPPRRPGEAVNQLGDDVESVMDAGEAPGGRPSTVVDVSEGVEVIREGPVTRSEIEKGPRVDLLDPVV